MNVYLLREKDGLLFVILQHNELFLSYFYCTSETFIVRLMKECIRRELKILFVF